MFVTSLHNLLSNLSTGQQIRLLWWAWYPRRTSWGGRWCFSGCPLSIFAVLLRRRRKIRTN